MAKVSMSCTASAQKPPRSAASHNLLKPCPSLARWRGSGRKKRGAELSGGIVKEPRRYPRNARNAAEIHGFCAAVPEVRIHLPPAASHERTARRAGRDTSLIAAEGNCLRLEQRRAAVQAWAGGFSSALSTPKGDYDDLEG